MNKVLVVVGGLVVLGIIVFIVMGQDNTAPEAETITVIEEEEIMIEEVTPGTIVDIAVATPDVSTLVSAVTAAGLVDTLAGEGPFTVFAPVNLAFAALPEATVESLLLPENVADLQNVLTYHVVSGNVLSGSLTDGMEVTTVNGDTITIGVGIDGVTVNGTSNVIAADIIASNGVIHLIDSVLLPPTE